MSFDTILFRASFLTIVKRLSAVALAVFAGAVLLNVRSGQAATDPSAFIEGLGNEAIQSMAGGNLPSAERETRLRKFMDAYFDVDGIGKFAIGRHWNKISDAQKEAYLAAFREYNVKNYASLLANYKGQKLLVERSFSSGAGISTVQSVILGSDTKDKIRIDWRLRQTDAGYKVVDVLVEGLSQATTLRDDFASTLQSNGIDGLTQALRTKIQQITQNN